MDKVEIKLPEAVAKAGYKPAPGAVQVSVSADLGKIDLNTISLSQADKLVQKGVLIKEETKGKEKGV
jgi:hypothetical protein